MADHAKHCLSLETLVGDYCVAKLAPGLGDCFAPPAQGFYAISVAEDEITITCRSDHAPPEAETDAGWTAIKVMPQFDFDEPGIVLSAIAPISNAGLGVFVISTFLRDYILVRTTDLDKARAALENAGHSVWAQFPNQS